MLNMIIDIPLKFHLFIAFVIRYILILYSEYHDLNFEVPFTDIDYGVFTDAARYVIIGESPYKRHTYRYSPIISYLMLPNVIFVASFGKIFFSICDIIVAVIIKKFIEMELKGRKKIVDKVSNYCSLFWLYNPLSIAISSRGSADSFPCIFILLSIYFLQKKVAGQVSNYIISGFFLGLSIHLRIYPIIFSYPMYLSLGNVSKITRNTKFRDALRTFIPNKNQLYLALSCSLTFLLLAFIFYKFYGFDFAFETYFYHVIRRDVKHNFSLFFYYNYISRGIKFDFVKLVCSLCEGLVLFLLSLVFGCDPKTLPFALFCQSVVLVIYNSVITSQYFIWFLSLLPLVAHNIAMPLSNAATMVVGWFLAQAVWLTYAYQLEFHCEKVLMTVGMSGLGFFVTNAFMLSILIRNYKTDHAFGKSLFIKKTS